MGGNPVTPKYEYSPLFMEQRIPLIKYCISVGDGKNKKCDESFTTDGLCDMRQVGPAPQNLTARLAAGMTSAWVSFLEDQCSSAEEGPELCVHEDVTAQLQVGT